MMTSCPPEMKTDGQPEMQAEPQEQEREVFRLVFVKWPWLWFTTQPVEQAFGDGWIDDFESAGPPWSYHRGPVYRQCKVAIDSDAYWIIESHHFPSTISPTEINRGEYPWLVPNPYYEHEGNGAPPGRIMAGTPMSQVIALIRVHGGKAYIDPTFEL